MPGDLVLKASRNGVTVRVGPVELPDALLLVDSHLAPNGWGVEFDWLMPADKAMNVFTASPTPRPVEEADLFVALRRAVYTDPEHDGIGCDRAKTLLTHLEPHRPVQMWTADDEACLLGECDHPHHCDEPCPQVRLAETLCHSCSVVYDDGSEWGPEWPAAGRVTWPCAPIMAAVNYYKISEGLSCLPSK